MSCQDVKRRTPLCAGDAAVCGRARVDTAEPARRGPAFAAKVPGCVSGARQIRVCQLSGKEALEPYACCFSVYNQVSIRRVHRTVACKMLLQERSATTSQAMSDLQH